MLAPVVLQRGRAAVHKRFEAFQKSVKENLFTYTDGKLSYPSETGQTFNYRANSKELPKIDGKTVNLNPAKTHASPYFSMDHGSNRAVISYPGQ
ncbi:MAG: hypothetical protein KDL87_17350, partial [Verrucomicrobiae bacterium]|nr:hypothetical protein [Verrucomicrobiae bacterium]